MKAKVTNHDVLWENLSSVLTHEINLYLDLVKLEEEKVKVIMDRNTTGLNKLIARQEQLIEKRDDLEQTRINSVKELSTTLGFTKVVYLSDLLNQKGAPVPQARVLFEKIKEFRRVAARLQSMLHSNRKLLENTYEFFEAIRTAMALDAKDNFVYSKDGAGDSTPRSRPIFLDTNC